MKLTNLIKIPNRISKVWFIRKESSIPLGKVILMNLSEGLRIAWLSISEIRKLSLVNLAITDMTLFKDSLINHLLIRTLLNILYIL
jgi:hypothetical protein